MSVYIMDLQYNELVTVLFLFFVKNTLGREGVQKDHQRTAKYDVMQVNGDSIGGNWGNWGGEKAEKEKGEKG